MQTKLTLRLEDHLIEQAKQYAVAAGKSLSQLVADYFKMLASENCVTTHPATPITQSLRGLLKDSTVDENDYRKHLEEKHR